MDAAVLARVLGDPDGARALQFSQLDLPLKAGARPPAIARTLTAEGWLSADGEGFTAAKVRAIMVRMGLPMHGLSLSAEIVRRDDELTVSELAHRLDRPLGTLRVDPVRLAPGPPGPCLIPRCVPGPARRRADAHQEPGLRGGCDTDVEPASHRGICVIGRANKEPALERHHDEETCLYTKRLDRGRFLWPAAADGAVTISIAQLGYLLSGIDWRMPQESWRPTAIG